MADNDIQKFVKASFLKDEDKALLLKMLENSEVKKFEKEFERMLVEEIERRKNSHFAICEGFNREMNARKSKVKEEQEALLAAVSSELSKISPTDISTRRRIWLDYDDKIQQMNQALLHDLNILFSQLTVRHV